MTSPLVQERGLPYILGQTSLNLILLTTKNDWKQSSTNPTKQFLIAFAMKSLGMDEQMVLFINSGVQERREHSALCLIHSSIYAVCPKGFHNQHGKTQRGSVWGIRIWNRKQQWTMSWPRYWKLSPIKIFDVTIDITSRACYTVAKMKPRQLHQKNFRRYPTMTNK